MKADVNVILKCAEAEILKDDYKIRRLEDENAALKLAFMKYGVHSVNCNVYVVIAKNPTKYLACSCGFMAALAMAETAGKGG